MTEDFLQFVWKYRLFSDMNKYSTAGDEIEIIEVGKQNFDSGPIFLMPESKSEMCCGLGMLKFM